MPGAHYTTSWHNDGTGKNGEPPWQFMIPKTLIWHLFRKRRFVQISLTRRTFKSLNLCCNPSYTIARTAGTCRLSDREEKSQCRRDRVRNGMNTAQQMALPVVIIARHISWQHRSECYLCSISLSFSTLSGFIKIIYRFPLCRAGPSPCNRQLSMFFYFTARRGVLIQKYTMARMPLPCPKN